MIDCAAPWRAGAAAGAAGRAGFFGAAGFGVAAVGLVSAAGAPVAAAGGGIEAGGFHVEKNSGPDDLSVRQSKLAARYEPTENAIVAGLGK